jgi:hypothetical protein
VDFQLSSGKKSLSGRIFLQSTNSFGDKQITTPLPNTTQWIESQPPHQEDQFPMTILQNSSETIVDNHQVQFNLENLPRSWEGLENHRRLPPIVIISEEVEEEYKENYIPGQNLGSIMTPSWLNSEYWESHSVKG